MRIAIVSDAWEPQINGVVRTYQNIARALRESGHVVEVIGPDRFVNFPMPGYGEIRLSFMPYRRLSRMLRDFAPDAIHVSVEGPLGWAARRYCIRHGLSFTTSFHTHFPDYAAQRVRFLGTRGMDAVRDALVAVVRRFHARAKCTFVATQSLEDQLRAWGFQRPMVRLLRGVDFDVFHPGARTLFLDRARPVYLYVGRVSVEKNLEAFLDADLPGTKVIVGDGPALEMFRKKYRGAIFTGIQQGKALADHYRSADVFVFPSKSDTFGIVLIEALACGLPVAGYDVTGPRDILTSPALGAVGNDLKASMTAALASPGSADVRAAHVRAHYSWPAVADVFAKTLEKRTF